MKRRAFRLGVGREHLAREIDDEIRFHLETKVLRLIAAGHSPESARACALSEFGDLERVRQDCIIHDHERERTMRRTNLLDELRQDVAYAARTLRRNRAFTAIVVLTLGIGVAANTSIFTLVNAVLLRPLPVAEPHQLLAIGDPSRVNSVSTGNPHTDIFSYPLYRDIRDNNSVVTEVFASGRAPRYLVRSTATESGDGAASRFVSGNYFAVLRVPALIGRTFDGSEDRSIGGSPFVVISYSFWKRRFGSNESVVGKRILVSSQGIPLTIIGVTPPWFTGEIVGQSIDMWLPLTMQGVMQPNQQMLDDRGASWLLLMGRLAPGVTIEQASVALTPIIRRSIAEHPVPGNAADPASPMFIASGSRGFSAVRASYGGPLRTLMAGVGLLLLVICANVANLLLARALARSKEMSVRTAIGAGRERLIRQLFTESLLLGLMGGAVGLAGAWWGSRMLLRLVADGSSALPIDVGLDLPVLAFTALTAVGAVVLFGLAPALKASRVDLATAMRANSNAVTGSGMSARGQRIPVGRILIGAQVALSMVLLVGASLLVRSLRSVQNADPGLARDRLLVADVNGVANGYTREKLGQLALRLATRVAAIPGVVAVSFSENGIFNGSESTTSIRVPGFAINTERDTTARYDLVGPGYANAIGARLLRGRDIGTQDVDGSANVIVINEAMADYFYRGSNPIGKSIRLNDSTVVQIVGVIANVKDHNLTSAVPPRMYMAFNQHLDGWAGSLRMEIRTKNDPANVANEVRAAIASTDDRLKSASIWPVTVLMRASIREERLLARLATGFGLLALLLAAVGLYGVMTYAVTRRTAEIGLRIALGAQRPDVIGMVLTEAMTVVVIGLGVGIPAAMASARLLGSQLHGIGATDPVAIGIAVGVMVSSAALAVLAPAIRASRVAPLLSLRQE